MRRRTILLSFGWLTLSILSAEPPTTGSPPADADDPGAAARARVPGLYQAWKNETDAAKRQERSDQLLDAIVHCYVDQPLDLADEVARDGRPKNEALAPKDSTRVTLRPLLALPDVHTIDYPSSPVFRRISARRMAPLPCR